MTEVRAQELRERFRANLVAIWDRGRHGLPWEDRWVGDFSDDMEAHVGCLEVSDEMVEAVAGLLAKGLGDKLHDGHETEGPCQGCRDDARSFLEAAVRVRREET